LSLVGAAGAVAIPLVAGAGAAPTPIGHQLAELKGTDTVRGDYFGGSVAISGTTAAVGASGHARPAGRAYLFQA